MTQSQLTPAVFQLDGSNACYYGVHDSQRAHSAGLCPSFPHEEVERMNEEQGDTWDTIKCAGIATDSAKIDFTELGWTWSNVPVGAGREFLLEPLFEREQAEQFILRLERAGLSFHFDDPVEEIEGPDGVRVFTDAEAAAVRVRVNELFELMGDPYGLAVVALEAGESTAVFRLQPLAEGGESNQIRAVKYHTPQRLLESYPDAKRGPGFDFPVGQTEIGYSAAEIGLFTLTRLQ